MIRIVNEGTITRVYNGATELSGITRIEFVHAEPGDIPTLVIHCLGISGIDIETDAGPEFEAVAPDSDELTCVGDEYRRFKSGTESPARPTSTGRGGSIL